MKTLILMFGLFFSVLGFSQPEKTGIPYAPKEEKKATPVEKKSVLKSDECPPASVGEDKNCDPKKICDPKEICKKPKPKVKPKNKPTPKPKPQSNEEKCPEAKVIEKTVTKTEYVDRIVTVDNSDRNTLSFAAGIGPDGIVTDFYETKDRPNEYTIRKEDKKANGAVIGLLYQYRTPPLGSFQPVVGAYGFLNKQMGITLGFSW